MGDGREEGVVEVSEGEVIFEDVSRVPEKEGRREVALRFCEYEERGASGADFLVEKRCMWVEARLCEEDDVLD